MSGKKINKNKIVQIIQIIYCSEDEQFLFMLHLPEYEVQFLRFKEFASLKVNSNLYPILLLQPNCFKERLFALPGAPQ